MDSELPQVRSACSTVSHKLAINHWWLWSFFAFRATCTMMFLCSHLSDVLDEVVTVPQVVGRPLQPFEGCWFVSILKKILRPWLESLCRFGCVSYHTVDPGEMAPWVIHPFSRRVSRVSSSLGSQGGSATKNTATFECSSPQQRLALDCKILFRTGNWTRAAFVLTDKTFSERQIKPFAAATHGKAFNRTESLNGKLKNINQFRHRKWFIMKR